MLGRLPTFLIIGAQKCGTSTLAGWLRGHPEVYFAEPKEMHFFSLEDHWARGVDWYREQFAGAGDETHVAEGTVHYLNFPTALDRIAEVLPAAKIIVCVRNPVERAYSSYRHLYFRLATEHRTFEQAIEDELRDARDLPGPGPCDYGDLGYLNQGHYAEQIDRVLERFPREQLHVVLLDDLEAAPREAFQAACRFLAIDADFTPSGGWPVENAHRVLRPIWLWRFMRRHRIFDRLPQPLAKFIALRLFRREATALDPLRPELRRRLGEHFAASNARLAAWLGRDLSAWDER